MKSVTIKIKPVPGTTLAESKDQAKQLREDKILPTLESGGQVKLDFSAVTFATQSFVHALISEAIRRHGEEVFEKLDFRGCSEDVQQIVLTVVDYTMQAHQAANPGTPDLAGIRDAARPQQSADVLPTHETGT